MDFLKLVIKFGWNGECNGFV